MKVHSPCLKCEARCPHCHSTCEAYAAYDALMQKRRAENIERHERSNDVYSIFMKRQERNMKYGH